MPRDSDIINQVPGTLLAGDFNARAKKPQGRLPFHPIQIRIPNAGVELS